MPASDDPALAFEPDVARRVRRLVRDLHAGAEPTMGEVAESLGVTDRHARRIVARLRADLPLCETMDGRAKRLSLAPENRRAALAPVPLTERERLALGVAVEAARTSLDGTPLAADLDRAARKLFEGAEETFWFDADSLADLVHFGGEGVAPMPGDVFDALLSALIDRRRVAIGYVNARGERSADRRLDPLGLAYRGGSWMLVARDAAHGGEVRHFSLVAVEAVTVLGEAIDRARFSLADHYRDTFRAVTGTEVVEVRLRVAPEKAFAFRRKLYHPTQQIEHEAPDGALTVSWEVAGLDDVAAFVRSFGPGVVAEAPPDLCARLADDARAVLAQYGAA